MGVIRNNVVPSQIQIFTCLDPPPEGRKIIEETCKYGSTNKKDM